MSKRTVPKGRRKRAPAKVKLGNLRVTPHCAKVVRRHARKLHIYPAHAVADVLERWAKRVRQREEREKGAPMKGPKPILRQAPGAPG